MPAGCLAESRLAYIGLRDVDEEEAALQAAIAMSLGTEDAEQPQVSYVGLQPAGGAPPSFLCVGFFFFG